LLGCSTTDPSKRYASEEHLLNKIETNDDEGYFIEYKSSIDAPQNKDKSIKYLEKGIALTRTVCFDYLNSLSANENDSQFLKNELGALVILSTGIMGLNGVSQDSFTRLALGGAAVNTTIDLYRNHYLLGPDSDVIVDLIKNAMNTAETEIGNRTPNNFVQAYTLLQSYSSLCSDSSIRRLVRDTIKSATLEASSPIVNIVAEEVLTQIAKEFGRSGLSDQQYFGLFWLSTEKPSKAEYKSIVDEALGDLLTDVNFKGKLNDLNTLTQIKYLFRRVRSLSSDYEKAIADAKEKIAQAENKIDSNNDLSNFIGTFSSISSSQALTSITSLAGNDEKLEYATERISNEILLKVPSQVMAISPNSGVQIKVK
jgi:hypothetical protein